MTDQHTDGRVWVVTECYPTPTWPTQCAFAHRQLAALARIGWDVNVLVPNGWHPPLVWGVAEAWREARSRHIPASWRPDGISVSDLTYQNRVPSRLSRPRDSSERIGDALIDSLARGGALPGRDLLLCQFALPLGPAVARASASAGIPFAVYLRGDDVWVWPRQSPRRGDEFGRTVRAADLVLAVSRSLLEEARRIAAAPLPRAAVVPNGLDLERFRPASQTERALARRRLGIPGDAVVVICVGGALLRKGWRELLTALAGVSVGHLVLLAVSSEFGSELNLSHERAMLAADLSCVFANDVPVEEMPGFYAAADVFCLPAYWEGMSNAVLEALACGLPVVTTPVGGHREVITDDMDGYLVPAREVEPLRRTLSSLLIDAALRQRLGAAARARAEHVGGANDAAARLQALLCPLMTGSLPAVLDDTSPYELAWGGER